MVVPWWYTRPSTDPRAAPVMKMSQDFFLNYSLHWLAGSGGSMENNAAWAHAELGGGGGGGGGGKGGGGLGTLNTQWSEQPVLDGLLPTAQSTWNVQQVLTCTALRSIPGRLSQHPPL